MRMLKKNSRQNKHSFQLKPICAAVLLVFSVQNADANPVGGAVVNGQASFNTTGNTLTVTNTPGTIINWQGFSIQQNEITRFAQQSASSAVLNRVITNNPSLILGTLQSNGRVFLVNPSGIVFGTGSTVDVAGLVATTQNLSNADFKAGRYQFTQVPGAQNISNAGNITAQSGGEIYLIAPNVENSGVITAPNGEILLVAGHEVQLVNSLDPNLRVNITAPAGNATNVGQLIASAGRLGLFGAVARNTGTVSADSATMQGGKIVFRASQRVEAGGTISAQGTGGGEIKLLADMQTGTVNVTGTLDASAPNSGNGGFVETSAAQVQVTDTARITTAAPNGNAGMWLIDPYDFTIASSGGDITGADLTAALGAGAVTIQTTASSVVCTGATCGTGNPLGAGDIIVNDNVSWSSNLLTLNAYHSININATMTATSGAGLAMTTGASGAVNVGMNTDGTFKGMVNLDSTTTLTINAQSYIIVNSLGVVGDGTTTTLQGMQNNLSGYYVLGSNIDATLTGTDPTWIAAGGFTPVGNSIGSAFSGQFNGLGHTISNLTINQGGTYAALFGNLNTGTVSNVALTSVNVTGYSYVGGLAGYMQNASISNSSVSGTVTGTWYSTGGLVGTSFGSSVSNSTSSANVSGVQFVGGLVGRDDYGSSVSNSSASGTVLGAGNSQAGVGGLVGFNAGSIVSSSSSGTVSGSSNVGGLVGYNNYAYGALCGCYTNGTISNSSATGDVTGVSHVGGLVGLNGSVSNTINASNASGNVSGNYGVGGLVGYSNFALISNSSASGNVIGNGTSSSNLGGLVGYNYSGTISNSNASGNVSGDSSSSNVGGLVGNNYYGTISNSHASIGSVTGGSVVGGLVGSNYYATISNSYVSSGSVTGVANVGGLVGINNYGTLSNSHYDINGVTVNGSNTVTLGGLYNDVGSGQFNDWYNGGALTPLAITNYSTLTNTGTNQYTIGDTNGMKDMLGFADTPGLTFTLTASVSLPAGYSIPYLAANFDGGAAGGYTITGLNISLPNDNLGLFNHIALGSVVSNVSLVGASVSGRNNVGALAGWNEGTINNSSVSGAVTVNGVDSVGGLVGLQGNGGNYSTGAAWGAHINNSYVSSGVITAARDIGGLVGIDNGVRTNSFFNVDSVTTNGVNNVTPGGLYNTQFTAWISGGLTPLVIGNYLTLNGGSYDIGTWTDMQNMLAFADNPAYSFSLTGSFSLVPGFNVPKLAGSFNGNSNTLSDLSINLPNSNIGLFGVTSVTSVVSNLNLVNANVTGYNNVGALAGNNYGNIDYVIVTGVVTVHGMSVVGGLVGQNNGGAFTTSGAPASGIISNSYVNGGTISSINGDVGGLVGSNSYGNIIASHVANTSVSGISNVGGLVGHNQGSQTTNGGGLSGIISSSYVDTGTVTSTGSSSDSGIGGLVGFNNRGYIGGNSVTNGDYVLNTNVDGGSALGVGGLVGRNGLAQYSGGNVGGTISYSYVSGGSVISTGNDVGGLVGHNNGALIDNSYVDTVIVQGFDNVGGLVGNDSGEGSNPPIGVISYSHAINTQVTGNASVGGLIGSIGIVACCNVSYDAVVNSYVSGGTVTSNATSAASAAAIGGLVGYNRYGNISGSYVTNGTVVTGGFAHNVGGLVGYNSGSGNYSGASYGRITASYVSGGTVTSGTEVSGDYNVGGLVGENAGYIDSSYVTGTTVNGTWAVGGLVGNNSGYTTNNYASNVKVSGSSSLGGLVGYNSGTISNSYVDGGVVGSTSSGWRVGGLVGYNGGSINTSYVVGGSVSGSSSVGGLVGYNSGSISMTYAASGSVSGGSNVGGLVGNNDSLGYVSDSYWDINTTLQGLTNGFGTDGSLGVNITNVLGLTTAQSMSQLSYTNFDFLGTWWMSDTNTRPFLQSEWTTNITNAHQLQLMTMDATTLSSSYTLANNIDLAPALAAGGMWNTDPLANLYGSTGFVPIGDWATPFTGQFNGQNFSISNLSIGGYASRVGLFGTVGVGASISNVGLINPNVSGSWSVGALAGENGGTISNSYVIMRPTDVVSGTSSSGVGGLVGYNYGTISSSYVSGGSVNGGAWTAGGLVGWNVGTISNSYMSGGTVTGGSNVGGLVGYNDSVNGAIVSSNFWDTTTAGVANGIGYDTTALGATDVGATGLTSAQMMQQSSFTGWDFTNTWRIYDGHTTPLLKSFLTPVTVTASGINGNFTKTYDGVAWNAPVLGTITYSDPAAAGLLNESTPFGAPVTNAGSYEMFWSGQQGYDISYTAGGMLTINPVTLSAISMSGTRAYDGTVNVDANIFTLSGLVGSETLALTGIGTINSQNVGTYSVTLGTLSLGTLTLGDGTNGGLASNYTFTGGTQTATITAAPLTLGAVTDTKVYDGTTSSVGVPTIVSGLMPGDSVTGMSQVFASKNVLGTNLSTLNVNGYTISDGNGGLNYAVTTNPAAGTITPATLALNAVTDTRTYNGTTASAGVVTYTGLQTGDSISATQTFGSKNVLGTNLSTLNVNGYTINDGNGGANYVTPTLNTAYGTITQANLIVTANNLNKVLGTPDPLLTYMVTNLYDPVSTTLSGTLARNSGQTIGSYTINQGTLTLLDTTNYYMTYNPGIFNILAPTVVQEITQISLLPAPKDGNALTSAEEEKRLAEQLAASELTMTEGGDGTTEPLRVCR
jgi:filamentous hemagglutinin family protein